MRTAILGIILACAAQAAWKAGAAKYEITPTESIWMAGYAARTKPSEGVRQPIYAKALALEDASGRRAIIVTLDLVSIRRPIADAVAERVRTRHSIPRDRLLFNVSHTHSAPLAGDITSYETRMGEYYARQKEVIARYTATLPDRIMEAVDKAVGGLAPATLHFEQGFAGFAVNRRRVGKRNLPGPVDHDVPVLAIRSGGELRAVLFGYACHNTVLSDYMINGDYAGYAQETLERRHPGAVALFVEGAGADSNPLPRRSVELAERYGQTLADSVDEVLRGKMRSVADTLAAAYETPELRFQAPPDRAELERRLAGRDDGAKQHAQRLLRRLEHEGRIPDRYPYPVQAWRFGNEFTLLALGGELVVDYSLRFKEKYGWDNLWVAGYSNDVFGYIPSLRVLREGGYEGGGAFQFSSFPGPLAEDVEDIIARSVDSVMGRAR
ncbi:MAG: neutral/alkaline non-lysosomal ceramidase N-terminal domain-containing protein [Bryobacteraceae bacterium]|nr:neutral/alkaline non-lysosomal ceramidase N-terminal domain-containing protein [Bryobacteraceae bacterium]